MAVHFLSVDFLPESGFAVDFAEADESEVLDSDFLLSVLELDSDFEESDFDFSLLEESVEDDDSVFSFDL